MPGDTGQDGILRHRVVGGRRNVVDGGHPLGAAPSPGPRRRRNRARRAIPIACTPVCAVMCTEIVSGTNRLGAQTRVKVPMSHSVQEHFQEAGFTFQHAGRAGKSIGSERGGHHAAFRPRGPDAAVSPSVRNGEFHQPAAGQRAGDAKRIGHPGRVQARSAPAATAAERTGGAGRGRLVAVFLPRRSTISSRSRHHTAVISTAPGRAPLLRRARGAAVAPGCTPAPGLVRLSGLERVRQRPVRQRRRRCPQRGQRGAPRMRLRPPVPRPSLRVTADDHELTATHCRER